MFPPQTLEIGGIIVFALIMALSNVAGIGGSELAIPMVMAMFHFTTKPAIAITSFSIFLTTLGRFIMNFKQAHPEKKNCVSIDYDLVSIMMPTTLAGTQIGALILISFPALYITIILTVLLLFLTIQTLRKAIKITKQENEKNNLAKVQPWAVPNTTVPNTAEQNIDKTKDKENAKSQKIELSTDLGNVLTTEGNEGDEIIKKD